MKVVILAGGLGTRLAEETETLPKPMVEIGGRPILWHIMKHYAHHGFREFVIPLGYKGDVIKRFFLDYQALSGHLTVDLGSGRFSTEGGGHDDWLVHLVDTGLATNTGGRVLRLKPWLEEETFMLTYGDGVSNVDLGELLRFHYANGAQATITAVRPPARFGGLLLEGDCVSRFTEKLETGMEWINGGFMVLNRAIFETLEGDHTSLEMVGLERLSLEKKLMAFRHHGFWQCMDTLRERRLLEAHWSSGAAPWKVW